MLIRSFRHRGTPINVHFHDFEETKHPRAKSGKTAGQFVKKGEESKSNETVHGPGSTGQSAEEQPRPDQGRSSGGSGGNGVRSDGLDIKSTHRPEGDTDESHVFHEVESSHHAARKYCNYITNAKNSSKYGAAVHVYPPEDYAKCRLFLSPDASAGFALKGDDIISVFKDKTGPLGACRAILDIATAQGGKRLDCFDTVLPAMYNQSGFQAVARMPFDDEYKPEGWDYDTFGKYKGGRPDVVFMVYDPDNKKMYSPDDGEVISDYDDGEKYQKQALEGKEETDIKVSFPLTEYPLQEILRNRELNYPSSARVSQQLPIDKLEADQTVIDEAHLAHVSKEPIEVVKFHGHYIIDDGHHRAEIASRRGDKTISAHVLDLDAPENSRFLSKSWQETKDAFEESEHPRGEGTFAEGKTSNMVTRLFKIRDKKFYLHVHDEFKETEHPRAKSGEFTKKGSGESGAVAGPTTTSTGVKPKAAPGAVVVNPIALILKKHGYEKQKGSNIYKHASGHEVEVHAATEGQKWLTGWTHSSGSTGSGAGRLDAHLESVSHSKPKTPTPKPEAEKPKPPSPKPEAEKEKEKPSTPPPPVKTASGAKHPSGSTEDNKARETHQKRIAAIIKEGGYVSGVATPPEKLKKMLTDVTSEIYDYMGVDKKVVTFTVAKMSLMKGPGGKKFKPGGYYTPLTNHLVVGINNSPEWVGGLSAHEIMHAKYQAVKRAYADEVNRIVPPTHFGPDGRIREQYQDEFPLHTARPGGFWGDMTALEKDDGVTDYSTDYWIAAKKGIGKQELAVNETLAEMAKLDWRDQLSTLHWFKTSTSYKPLYEAIHKLYPAVVAKAKLVPVSSYPKQLSTYKKDGFDRAYRALNRTILGYGKGFTASINPNSGNWTSNHGNGSDYASLLKALEKYKWEKYHEQP